MSFDWGKVANLLSYDLMRELTEAACCFEKDFQTSAIVLTGRPDHFSMVFDLKDPETIKLSGAGFSERRQAVTTGKRMCEACEEM